MKKTYKNVYDKAGYLFLILLLFVLVGFFKTYFGLFPNFHLGITNVVHFHFFVMMLWIFLLLIQPNLIRRKKYNLHRFFGKLSYILAPLMVASLISLLFKEYYDFKLFEEGISKLDVIKFFYYPGVHTICFAVFYVLAIINKKNAFLHGSYMIATGITLIKPALTRVILHTTNASYALEETITICFIDITILSIIFYLRSRKLNFKPFIVILLILSIYHVPKLIEVWS